MTSDDTPRERLARLETKVEHLSEELKDTHSKVVEMHELLLQAKGARWVIVGIAGVAGYVASYLPKVSALISGLPK